MLDRRRLATLRTKVPAKGDRGAVYPHAGTDECKHSARALLVASWKFADVHGDHVP
jgi:hypothetical protein